MNTNPEDELFILSLPISLDEMDDFFNVYFSEQVKDNYPLLTNNLQKQHHLKNYSNNDIKTIKHVIDTKQYIERNPLSMKNSLVTIDEIPCIPHSNEYSKNDLLTPSKTDIHCWWCCHQFNTPIVYAPTHYHHKKAIFKVKGVFCSYSCSYAYTMKDPTIKDKSLIKFMYKIITGNIFKNINPAPPKEILKIFGGSKSIEDFRKYCEDTKYTVCINTYPLVYVSQQVETREIVSLVDESLSNVRKVKNAKINIKREVPVTVKPSKKKEKCAAVNGSLEAMLGIVTE